MPLIVSVLVRLKDVCDVYQASSGEAKYDTSVEVRRCTEVREMSKFLLFVAHYFYLPQIVSLGVGTRCLDECCRLGMDLIVDY